MLTVLIETHNDEEGLARTLSSLVAGSVEGVVREVLVHDRGSTDQTAYVADHAGCGMIAEGELAAGLRRARGDWLMVLEPGARLTEGWTEAVMLHMSSGTTPARFSRSRIGRPRFLARLFSTRRPFADGLVITKRQALALLKGGRRPRLDHPRPVDQADRGGDYCLAEEVGVSPALPSSRAPKAT
ncbi:glycosyltransferase [Mesorhizobium sp. J428]|uniref:glycosyltransferase n=1 Tax=Mesorhizobium sp. J428 TaxID=2898440 RepID=UPI0027E224BF|nr:glycosyltransferase [Mesorhizobium sp. J428]